ncbi:MAG: 16S rRNA (cytosine(1402)-N(4))-methyltransferase RsmH [Rhodospirillales bacterium]|nr:16S rRNA (cytosine(1402)-N(4))-methyltransferase RsmH [Rhodospirillales bacterium]
MLAEMLDGMAPRADGVYVDATFGGGGYTRALLDAAACRVWGIDRDPDAVARADVLCRRYAGRLTVLPGSFGDLANGLGTAGIDRVDGIIFDLGMSSQQLETPERGFSFRLDGPLDMRMDPSVAVSAGDVVNTASAQDLARILRSYGEERSARRIARAIVEARETAPIIRTGQLAAIVHRVLAGPPTGIDAATRTFQALRIYVNDELGELDRGLLAAEHLLAPGGRLGVVAYHSLEDRRVKMFMRTRSGVAPRASRHHPDGSAEGSAPSLRLVHRRALRPTAAEIAANPRARSARMRVAERTAAPAWPSSSEGGRTEALPTDRQSSDDRSTHDRRTTDQRAAVQPSADRRAA